MQKSCNEFQGFVLLCSLPLRQLSLSEISFSLSETLLTLFGRELAVSFCRINNVVPFTCQFWNRNFFFFSSKLSVSGNGFAERTWTSPALVLKAYGSKHIYH